MAQLVGHGPVQPTEPSKRSPVHFPVRAHAWIVGSVPGQGVCEIRGVGVCGRHLISVFLPRSPSLPLSLKINK